MVQRNRVRDDARVDMTGCWFSAFRGPLDWAEPSRAPKDRMGRLQMETTLAVLGDDRRSRFLMLYA